MVSSILLMTRAWLSASKMAVGTSALMPLIPGEKRPMHKHSNGHVWSEEMAEQYAHDHPGHNDWGLLLDEPAVVKMEQLAMSNVPELSCCPCQRTRKGMHYMFLRPQWADAEGYWDGARQVEGCAVDLKTRCSTGTRGMLVISPTPGKEWLPGRAPWEVKAIPEMPRLLMECVASPKGKFKPTSRSLGNTNGLGMVTLARTQQCQGQIPDGILCSVKRIVEQLGSKILDDRGKWLRVAMFLKSESEVRCIPYAKDPSYAIDSI